MMQMMRSSRFLSAAALAVIVVACLALHVSAQDFRSEDVAPSDSPDFTQSTLYAGAPSEAEMTVDANETSAGEANETSVDAISPEMQMNATTNATEEDDGCVDEIWEAADTTCEQHAKEWGQCGESFMQGWCKQSCGTCNGEVLVVEESEEPEAEAVEEESGGSLPELQIGADTSGFVSRDECLRKGTAFLSNLDAIASDEGAMSCASGPTGTCCSALNGYLGPGSEFYGCPCYGDLYSRALSQIPSFIKPIVERSLQGCGIPTPSSGCRG